MPESHPEADTETNSIIAVAEEKLGVDPWERPAIYTDSAEAATDGGLPYWAVLVLSGGIATLGLALDSSAVVIGAMLVAPLLAPVIGLALSLAVGDGKLAVQTAAIVLASTAAVILIGAALTALLPFHTITLEISARTRPTTLDLVIAVFSGLVGAVVTVARGSRLSAAIPGVAISVALIPPLAVAGFGIGIGWNWELIRGSLLLYGANLAGIVLSGMGVFLLVGMHRPDVLDTARGWHEEEEPTGIAGWAGRARWVRSLGVFHSAWARVGMVGAFAVALGFPLSETLTQIAREARVDRAVNDTAGDLFGIENRASILSRQIVYGTDRTQVYLRVATTQWFDPDTREAFERRASAIAGEPVRLTLEQLPTRGEDLDQLAELLPGGAARPVASAAAPPPAPSPAGMGELLTAAGMRLRQVQTELALPRNLKVLRTEVAMTDGGRATLRLAYAAPGPLPIEAQEMLREQLADALELPELNLRLTLVSTAPRTLTGTSADSLALSETAERLRTYDRLSVEVDAAAGFEDEADVFMQGLVSRGIDPGRIAVGRSTGADLRVQMALASAGAEPRTSPGPGS